MKVKALWGFVGQQGKIKTGEEFEVTNDYGKQLITKGLAKELSEKSPNNNKATKPAENKQAKKKKASKKKSS